MVLELAELLGTLPEDVAVAEVDVPLDKEMVDDAPVEDATIVPLDDELVDALPVEVDPVNETAVLVSEVEDATLEDTVPFVDKTGDVLLTTVLLTPVLFVTPDEATEVDVPLVEVAVLE